MQKISKKKNKRWIISIKEKVNKKWATCTLIRNKANNCGNDCNWQEKMTNEKIFFSCNWIQSHLFGWLKSKLRFIKKRERNSSAVFVSFTSIFAATYETKAVAQRLLPKYPALNMKILCNSRQSTLGMVPVPKRASANTFPHPPTFLLALRWARTAAPTGRTGIYNFL